MEENSRNSLRKSEVKNCAVSAVKNGRRKMEDRHVVLHDLKQIFDIPSLPKDDNGALAFYAVYDGHAGKDAAAFAASHLHRFILESKHFPENPQAAITEAFVKTDNNFLNKSQKEPKALKSGTTAVTCLIRGSTLYIAWLGDSQAVLVRNFQPVKITDAHKPNRPDEQVRIEQLGGSVTHYGTWRVNGQLAVSRAIGDFDYKPWVTSEPDVTTVELNGTEDFIIIACDGLWDTVTPEDAIAAVREQITRDKELSWTTHNLVALAKNTGSTDNITILIVFLKPVEVLQAEAAASSNPNQTELTTQYAGVSSTCAYVNAIMNGQDLHPASDDQLATTQTSSNPFTNPFSSPGGGGMTFTSPFAPVEEGENSEEHFRRTSESMFKEEDTDAADFMANQENSWIKAPAAAAAAAAMTTTASSSAVAPTTAALSAATTTTTTTSVTPAVVAAAAIKTDSGFISPACNSSNKSSEDSAEDDHHRRNTDEEGLDDDNREFLETQHELNRLLGRKDETKFEDLMNAAAAAAAAATGTSRETPTPPADDDEGETGSTLEEILAAAREQEQDNLARASSSDEDDDSSEESSDENREKKTVEDEVPQKDDDDSEEDGFTFVKKQEEVRELLADLKGTEGSKNQVPAGSTLIALDDVSETGPVATAANAGNDVEESSAPSSLDSQTAAPPPASVIIESQEVPRPDQASFILQPASEPAYPELPSPQEPVFEVIPEPEVSSTSPILEEEETMSENGEKSPAPSPVKEKTTAVAEAVNEFEDESSSSTTEPASSTTESADGRGIDTTSSIHESVSDPAPVVLPAEVPQPSLVSFGEREEEETDLILKTSSDDYRGPVVDPPLTPTKPVFLTESPTPPAANTQPEIEQRQEGAEESLSASHPPIQHHEDEEKIDDVIENMLETVATQEASISVVKEEKKEEEKLEGTKVEETIREVVDESSGAVRDVTDLEAFQVTEEAHNKVNEIEKTSGEEVVKNLNAVVDDITENLEALSIKGGTITIHEKHETEPVSETKKSTEESVLVPLVEEAETKEVEPERLIEDQHIQEVKAEEPELEEKIEPSVIQEEKKVEEIKVEEKKDELKMEGQKAEEDKKNEDNEIEDQKIEGKKDEGPKVEDQKAEGKTNEGHKIEDQKVEEVTDKETAFEVKNEEAIVEKVPPPPPPVENEVKEEQAIEDKNVKEEAMVEPLAVTKDGEKHKIEEPRVEIEVEEPLIEAKVITTVGTEAVSAGLNELKMISVDTAEAVGNSEAAAESKEIQSSLDVPAINVIPSTPTKSVPNKEEKKVAPPPEEEQAEVKKPAVAADAKATPEEPKKKPSSAASTPTNKKDITKRSSAGRTPHPSAPSTKKPTSSTMTRKLPASVAASKTTTKTRSTTTTATPKTTTTTTTTTTAAAASRPKPPTTKTTAKRPASATTAGAAAAAAAAPATTTATARTGLTKRDLKTSAAVSARPSGASSAASSAKSSTASSTRPSPRPAPSMATKKPPPPQTTKKDETKRSNPTTTTKSTAVTSTNSRPASSSSRVSSAASSKQVAAVAGPAAASRPISKVSPPKAPRPSATASRSTSSTTTTATASSGKTMTTTTTTTKTKTAAAAATAASRTAATKPVAAVKPTTKLNSSSPSSSTRLGATTKKPPISKVGGGAAKTTTTVKKSSPSKVTPKEKPKTNGISSPSDKEQQRPESAEVPPPPPPLSQETAVEEANKVVNGDDDNIEEKQEQQQPPLQGPPASVET